MSAPLPIILPENTFQSSSIYDPITDAVELCIDEYMTSGFNEEKLPPLLAGLYHIEYFHGRVCGGGCRQYLADNLYNFERNFFYAKIGAEAIGWTYGVNLIESVNNWSVENRHLLDTLEGTKQCEDVLRAFNVRLFQNNLSRGDAEALLGVLPDDIKDRLLQEFDADEYLARSEFHIRSFTFLWTSELVKTVAKDEVNAAVEAAMEASQPGLAAKTRAEKKAAYRAS
jgi:hypothetical protein